MKFEPTSIEGVFVVDLEPIGDDRGFFARFFCTEEFEALGLTAPARQGNTSYTAAAGTVRGLHWQAGQAAEAKLFRCISGAVFDVALDMRPESTTYLRHVSVELSAANRRALYVPEGVAHGFQTLEPDSEVLYLVSAPYDGAAERGVRPDDPTLAIEWPLAVTDLSAKDRSWPLVSPHDAGGQP